MLNAQVEKYTNRSYVEAEPKNGNVWSYTLDDGSVWEGTAVLENPEYKGPVQIWYSRDTGINFTIPWTIEVVDLKLIKGNLKVTEIVSEGSKEWPTTSGPVVSKALYRVTLSDHSQWLVSKIFAPQRAGSLDWSGSTVVIANSYFSEGASGPRPSLVKIGSNGLPEGSVRIEQLLHSDGMAHQKKTQRPIVIR